MISEANSKSASVRQEWPSKSFGPLRSARVQHAVLFCCGGSGGCLRAKFTQGAKRRVHRVDGFNPVIYRPWHIRLFKHAVNNPVLTFPLLEGISRPCFAYCTQQFCSPLQFAMPPLQLNSAYCLHCAFYFLKNFHKTYFFANVILNRIKKYRCTQILVIF
jgi:hypothetical protein